MFFRRWISSQVERCCVSGSFWTNYNLRKIIYTDGSLLVGCVGWLPHEQSVECVHNQVWGKDCEDQLQYSVILDQERVAAPWLLIPHIYWTHPGASLHCYVGNSNVKVIMTFNLNNRRNVTYKVHQQHKNSKHTMTQSYKTCLLSFLNHTKYVYGYLQATTSFVDTGWKGDWQ